MFRLPPDDNKDNNTPCLTLEQQFYLKRLNLELEGRDVDLIEIINNLQCQIFGMQNFLKSQNPFK